MHIPNARSVRLRLRAGSLAPSRKKGSFFPDLKPLPCHLFAPSILLSFSNFSFFLSFEYYSSNIRGPQNVLRPSLHLLPLYLAPYHNVPPLLARPRLRNFPACLPPSHATSLKARRTMRSMQGSGENSQTHGPTYCPQSQC